MSCGSLLQEHQEQIILGKSTYPKRFRPMVFCMSDKMRVLIGVFCCAISLVVFVSSSSADTLVWSNRGTGSIDYTTLDGSDSGVVNTGATAGSIPSGTSFDSATQTFYWADGETNTINYAKADGSSAGQLNTSGATVNAPAGLIVDPEDGRVYWANEFGSAPISYANLDGSGGADLSVSGAPDDQPIGLSINPLTQQVYWANATNIAYAALDGSGGGTLITAGGSPTGVTVDPTGDKVYWGTGSSIDYAAADGSGSISSLTTNDRVTGAALDTAEQALYGAGSTTNLFMKVMTDGSGFTTIPSSAGLSIPEFPILIKVPENTEAPQLSGGTTVGSDLHCSTGSWASDVLGTYTYQQPASFTYTWKLNGQTVSSNTTTFTTDTPGVWNQYDGVLSGDDSNQQATSSGAWSCVVKADNYAGSTTVSSNTVKVTAPVTPINPTSPSAPVETSTPASVSKQPAPLVISNLYVTPDNFRVGNKPTRLQPVLKGAPTGTKIRFTLSAPAKVKFWIKHLPQRRPLKSYPTGFTRNGTTGDQSVSFTGVFPGGKVYQPGSYVLYAQATDPATDEVGNTTETGFKIWAGSNKHRQQHKGKGPKVGIGPGHKAR